MVECCEFYLINRLHLKIYHCMFTKKKLCILVLFNLLKKSKLVLSLHLIPLVRIEVISLHLYTNVVYICE